MKLPIASYVWALLFGAVAAGLQSALAGVHPGAPLDWVGLGSAFLVGALASLASATLHYTLPSPAQQELTSDLRAIVATIVATHPVEGPKAASAATPAPAGSAGEPALSTPANAGKTP